MSTLPVYAQQLVDRRKRLVVAVDNVERKLQSAQDPARKDDNRKVAVSWATNELIRLRAEIDKLDAERDAALAILS